MKTKFTYTLIIAIVLAASTTVFADDQPAPRQVVQTIPSVVVHVPLLSDLTTAKSIMIDPQFATYAYFLWPSDHTSSIMTENSMILTEANKYAQVHAPIKFVEVNMESPDGPKIYTAFTSQASPTDGLPRHALRDPVLRRVHNLTLPVITGDLLEDAVDQLLHIPKPGVTVTTTTTTGNTTAGKLAAGQ